MGGGAVVRGDLGPADLHVVVPDVADGRVEDPRVGLEHRRDERAHGAGLTAASAGGDPHTPGDVGLDRKSPELHGWSLPRKRTTPGLFRGAVLRRGSCTRADWTNVGGPGVG
jgi:hypothetical protein